jgi:hypothetical protein
VQLHVSFGAMRALHGLLLSAATQLCVRAGPTVNVALRASFNAAPYLVELLYVPPRRLGGGAMQPTD